MKTASHSDRGVALIIVLSLILLVSVLIVTFMTQASLSQKVASSSVSQTSADQIAHGALDVIVGDLRGEMAAGSTVTFHDDTLYPIYQPTSVATVGPHRSGAGSQLNLVKRSSFNSAFYEGDDYTGTPPQRASDAPSTGKSANGRLIRPNRWETSRLLDGAIPASPDWVYVTRTNTGRIGSSPIAASHMPQLRNPTNDNFVIGRFTYLVYDTGGLLDINVAGNALTDNARRGRLHQAQLDAIPGLTGGDDLVEWRWPGSATDGGNIDFGLWDPERHFRSVAQRTGDRAFLSRQELIAYARDNSIPLTVLRYLSTFSREKNAPSWLSWDDRFTPDMARKADGTRRFESRFPLHRIGLLPTASTDVVAWFGLTLDEDTGIWNYDHGVPGRILDIFDEDDLALMGEREPDFFELLKAVLPPASLGAFPGGGVGHPAHAGLSEAQRRDAHILQIGANIIDQYDADSRPMDIYCAFVPGGGNMDFRNRIFGIENLPYLKSVRGELRHNDADNTVRSRYLFVMADPFKDRRSGVERFRIQALGSAHLKSGNVGQPPSDSVVYSSSASLDPAAGEAAGRVDAMVENDADRFIEAGTLNGVAAPANESFQILPYAAAATEGRVTFVLQYQGENDAANVWHPYAVWHEAEQPMVWDVGGLPTGATSNSKNTLNKSDARTERVQIENLESPPAAPPDATPVLNLAFRSAGELGNAYRDAPFARLNLFAIAVATGDAGVLDLFSVNASPIVAGKIGLRHPEVVASMLWGAENDPFASPATTLSDAQGDAIAAEVVGTTTLESRGHLAKRLADSGLSDEHRFAAARALADVTNTRTWNLMIDVIAQSGRFPPSAPETGAANENVLNTRFIVEGERRYWLHLAIDRYTGEIIEQQLERVDE